jgi:hypothetical protein
VKKAKEEDMRSFQLSPEWSKGFSFLALLLSLALFPALKNPAAEVVYMGIATAGLYELPSEIAQKKGFYTEEGLEVRKVVVRTGLQPAALLAGELDYSTITGVIMRAAMQGMPLRPELRGKDLSICPEISQRKRDRCKEQYG